MYGLARGVPDIVSNVKIQNYEDIEHQTSTNYL